MGEVFDRALAAPEVLGAVATVILLAVVMVAVPVVRGLRRRKRERWLRRDRYHQPLPSVAAAQKLGIQRVDARDDACGDGRDDVGLRLREAVQRLVAERPKPDIEAEIAAIDEWARKRGLP